MPTEQCNRVQVEQYFLGETGTEEKHSARLHLDGCADCRGHLAALENDKREYLIAHPFRDFAAKHLPEGKAGRSVRFAGPSAWFAGPSAWFAVRNASFGPRWLPAMAGLAACLVLVPVFLHYNDGQRVVTEKGIRTKGGTIMEYYVKRGQTVAPGSTSEAYHSGDELQFVYASGGHAYVTLASIDSRGHVSLYRKAADSATPAGGEPLSLRAVEGEKQSLPFAVTLDDSPGSEFFVMIYGKEPLSDQAVESWLTEAYTRATGNLEGLSTLLSPPPGPGSEIKVLLLRKTQA
ncbi:MAG: zf-HC2 domain-containing protein [Fibrobacterota bacterium]|nr:zf-HC2 domain-containing protein [Fibrobacterota bacterium]